MDSKLAIRLSALQEQVKATIESQWAKAVWLTAEINHLTAKPGGHCYLELVDYEDQQLMGKAQAWIPSATFRMLKPYFETTAGLALASGLTVLLKAKVQYHPVYGLSLQVLDIDPVYTVGNIVLERQKSLKSLEREGVLDMNASLELPLLTRRIAIISSEQAAGFRDFREQLQNNAQGYAFYWEMFSSLMQGNEAAEGIIKALEAIALRLDDFDAVILVRGGGAVSDLLCFDDYNLAFHIAQFPIPVLVGVGHDQDRHLVDMVAHTSVKTPTALAEFLIGHMADAEALVWEQWQRLRQHMIHKMGALKEAPLWLFQRLKARVASALQEQTHRLALLEQSVATLNPLAPLQRGYALVLKEGVPQRDPAALAWGECLDVWLERGQMRVTKIEDYESKEQG
jgi:Exonuclease VII, large subunit